MKDNVERAIKKNYKDTANYKSFVWRLRTLMESQFRNCDG
jgi:hypothetical protein